MPLGRKTLLAGDIMSAWRTIANGVVAANSKKREKYWRHWEQYCKAFNKHPHLTDCSPTQQILILTAFAARVRTGYYGKGETVKVQSVQDALAAISKTIELGGQPSPVYKAEKTYKVPVARLVEGMRRQDPQAIAQIAVPISIPNEVLRLAQTSTCPKERAVGDLTIIAFFYLLRVGEYTKPKFVTIDGERTRATRTVQFQVGHVGFFKNNAVLPRTSPLATLYTANSCTLKITNQKNGRMGQTIHHHATGAPNCPIRAIARRVHHILTNNGNSDNILCDVRMTASTSAEWLQVTPGDMIKQLRHAVRSSGLIHRGIAPDLVGVHSLRAGGAMALKLTGSSDTTIMKMGRWTSLTFLNYIHEQIAHLSADLSQQMSTQLEFTNIAAIERA
jgi:hypothetical protein